MYNPMCNVCRDKNHFDSMLQQAEKSLFLLKKLINVNIEDVRFSIKKERLFYNLNTFSSKPRVMCGKCNYTNERLYDKIEEDIDILLCYFILNNHLYDRSIYMQILQILRGQFAHRYRVFERAYFENLNKNK